MSRSPDIEASIEKAYTEAAEAFWKNLPEVTKSALLNQETGWVDIANMIEMLVGTDN